MDEAAETIEQEERFEQLLTPDELSAELGIPIDEVKSLTRKRKIPHYRFTSRTIRYRLDRVKEALEQDA